MGGGKKRPTVSSLEKRTKKTSEGKKEEAGKKPQMKLSGTTGELTDVSMEAVIKDIKGLKYLTPYILASRLGLKLSRAKRVLRDLEARGILVAVDKNSRVPIYAPAGKKS
ncbi:MAG: 30S ribosomal protein S25e [Infirmifilum sp.]